MKRYISLILVAAVLVISLAVPSYAAEQQWFNVLDFASPNNSGTNFVSYSNGSTITFDLPRIEGAYFDIVVQFRSGFTGLTVTTTNGSATRTLSVQKIDNYCYRLFGYVGLDFTTGIPLTFTLSGYNYSRVDMTFLSFKMSNVLIYSSDCSVYGSAYFRGSINSSFTYSGSPVSILIPTGSLSSQDDARIYLDLTDWKKYDFIELYINTTEMAISSVSVTLDNQVVPFTLSYLDSDSVSANSYFTLFIDLTGINRDTTIPVQVGITGQTVTLDSQNASFALMFCSGYLDNAGLSQFAQLRLSLSTWLTNLSNSITGAIAVWGQNIVNAITGDSSQVEQNNTIQSAIQDQQEVNQQLNIQLDSAVQDWNDNFDSVSGGFNTAFTDATPALIWLSGKAQDVFNNMGWFGNMFFFLGFLHVVFLILGKSGLGQKITERIR